MANNKTLIAYFSLTQNTKKAANALHSKVKSDVFEILAKQPYTAQDIDYNTKDCRAEVEANTDARPEVANKIENFDDYDVFFIGFPIWWYTVPKVVCTFLESYDFKNKTVIPFCTSGGSSLESIISDFKKCVPNANVKKGKLISSYSLNNDIQSLINQLD
ncbi:conserved hypothetical protein [Malacoplasma penetrans HF-2]|uniref:Flavodoxin-like domain-containing protein n=1 Tax=Malacoplasma penetrans (strain HF-2) TaxID=272633 RepID=Q8EV89_MALP2|nr:flavodoxin [Malacoplasma penetrans]BAC44469.1 conserved hypothetical protein [Malacoplasma penetrans HF-2]